MNMSFDIRNPNGPEPGFDPPQLRLNWPVLALIAGGMWLAIATVAIGIYRALT